MNHHKLLFLLTSLLPAVIHAQQRPDAGRVQRDSAPPVLQAPKESPGLRIEAETDETTEAGGPQARVTKVEFSGNTLLTDNILQSAIADLLGNSLDLAGLRGLTQRVSDRYAAAGYTFTKAYLPPQELKDGVLKIAVLEGRYGKITVEGETRLASASLPFLGGLSSGDPIDSTRLERRLLVLSDQPGVKMSPLLRSGDEEGTGDLVVTVERVPPVNIDAGYDNHGSLFTGEHRARLNARVDSPFRFGDQIQLRAVSSTENLWLGNIAYSFPLGTSGRRLSLNHSRTAYELGGDFRSLEASGTADTTSAGMSFVLRRSSVANTSLSLTLERKTLRDQLGAIDSDERKSSRNLGVVLQFDRQGAGGVTYGSVGIVPGELRLNGEVAVVDAASGRKADGGFIKWNLDVARLQPIGSTGITIFGRLAAQRADQNLDSSEKFSLGGPYAVRAYPAGEGSGDEGTLAQLEVRTVAGSFAPFLFIDAARSKLNANVESLLSPLPVNTRSIIGAGVGTRFTRGAIAADGVLAWRVKGGAPLAENDDSAPRVWVTLSYRVQPR